MTHLPKDQAARLAANSGSGMTREAVEEAIRRADAAWRDFLEFRNSLPDDLLAQVLVSGRVLADLAAGQVAINAQTRPTQMVRIGEVLKLRGKSRSTHYDDIRRGLFTPAVAIGQKQSAWPLHEMEAVNQARLRGASDEEVRDLVKDLIGRRGLAKIQR